MLIWAALALLRPALLCFGRTRARPGDLEAPLTASPGHWPLPQSWPRSPGEPAFARQGQEPVPVASARSCVFSLKSSWALRDAGRFMSASANINNSTGIASPQGTPKAPAPASGPAIGEGRPSPHPAAGVSTRTDSLSSPPHLIAQSLHQQVPGHVRPHGQRVAGRAEQEVGQGLGVRGRPGERSDRSRCGPSPSGKRSLSCSQSTSAGPRPHWEGAGS